MKLESGISAVVLPNGETIAYRKAGSGEQIVMLVHGNMTSSKHWDVLMERLQDEYTIYAPDLRGFGASTYQQPISSLKEFSEDVKQFADALGLQRFSIAGWSTGGGIGMQFAIDYPERVEKLVLIESVGIQGYPILKKDAAGQPVLGEFLTTKEEIAADPVQVAPVLQALQNRDKEFYRALWNLVIYTHKQPEPDHYEEYLEDMLTQRNLVDVDYALATFNISEEHNGVVAGTGEVRKLNAPTLVIQGARDYVVPPAMGEGIAKAVPQAEYVLLPDCGHSPLVDCLDALVNTINSFLKG
ncbi:intracellular short-chain-length polyhydroxyalkanoate depolymerase [Ectobacillus ponti]